MHQRYQDLGRHGTVGLEFFFSILFGFLGGRWLDEKLGAHGWLTMIGFGFGVAAGFRFLWRAAQRATREAEEEDARERARKRGSETDGTRHSDDAAP